MFFLQNQGNTRGGWIRLKPFCHAIEGWGEDTKRLVMAVAFSGNALPAPVRSELQADQARGRTAASAPKAHSGALRAPPYLILPYTEGAPFGAHARAHLFGRATHRP